MICLQASGVCIHARDLAYRPLEHGNKTNSIGQPGFGCTCDRPWLYGHAGFEDAHMYGPADEQEAIATIQRSLELGGNFLDTADLYGPLKNEQLIAKAINGKRDQYILASKFGWEIDDNNKVTWAINGKKYYVKKSLERSLKNLNTDYIDCITCTAWIKIRR